MKSDQVLYATKGNTEAARFLELITSVLHFWDDLVDKDKPIPDDYIHLSMWQALVELPRNRFYQLNFSELNPILCTAIQNWLTANKIEATGTREDRHISFIIRSSYCDLVIHTATLCGGFEHGRDVAERVRTFWHDERFEGYLLNLAKQSDDASEIRRGTYGLQSV